LTSGKAPVSSLSALTGIALGDAPVLQMLYLRYNRLAYDDSTPDHRLNLTGCPALERAFTVKNLDTMEFFRLIVITGDKWKKSGRKTLCMEMYLGSSTISLCSDVKCRV
jgi:hypothetical protein